MNDFSLLQRHHDHKQELEREADNERLIREALAYRRKTATRRAVIPYRLILAWVGRRLIVVGARLQSRYGEVRHSAALSAVLDLYRHEQSYRREQSYRQEQSL